MVDNTVANIWGDIIRTIYRLLDTVVYWLLGLMYQIFFNVASAELFTNETIKNFYGRVQLILGVFMIFKLAVSIVKGIVNPDTFVDKKEGMGNIIYRIMFALVMLTIIAPINIPNARNEYEIQLNNNGLLFGTLYSLQNRILSNNTLGKLILGTNDGVTVQVGNTNSGSQKQKLKEAADLFTSTILKGFIRINLSPDAASDDETQSSNWMCKDDLDEDTKQAYTGTTSEVPDPEVIIGLTSLKCDSPNAGTIAKIFNSDQRYMFAYRGLISAIVGGVFVYILLNFTVDIAVRAIKLAILRLLAPIPIIAYIDPNGEKQAFNSWTKLLTSTYLDLFLRLAIIYFVIFLVQDITMNGLVMNQATGVVGILTYIFIFLGLFIFAKQAPKFIKQVFGMKDDGGKLFGGLGEAIGAVGWAASRAAAPLAVGLGGVGAAAAGYRAAQAENDALHPGSRLNGLRNFGAGLVNAMGARHAGAQAIRGAKDHHLAAAMKAMQQHNVTRAAHSTPMGRFVDNMYGLANGRTLAEVDQGVINDNKAAVSSLKNWKKMLQEESKKSGTHQGTVSINGQQRSFNYEKLVAAKSGAHNGVFSYNGVQYNVSDFDSNVMSKIEDTQAQAFYQDWRSGAVSNGKMDTEWQNVQKATHDAGMDRGETYVDSDNNTHTWGAFTGAYTEIGAQIGRGNKKQSDMETNMRNIMHRANSQSNKK